MAEPGLAGRVKKRRRSLTRQGKRPVAPDLVRRMFTAPTPDAAWCGGMTEIPTDEGRPCIATVIDLHSRRLLGYAMDTRHGTELVIGTQNMAAATRSGDVRDVILHTDRAASTHPRPSGTPAAAWARCHREVVQSMGRVGSALDNAVAEATNSSIKAEYIHQHRFKTRAKARIKTATWITDWHNPHRRYSACDWLSPIDCESGHTATEQQPQAA